MIFEYTDKTDLQEYLVSHSPQGDFAQPPASSASSHVSSVMDQNDFMKMAMQVSVKYKLKLRNQTCTKCF